MKCVHVSELQADDAEITKYSDSTLAYSGDVFPFTFTFSHGGGINGYRYKSPLTPLTLPNPSFTKCTEKALFSSCTKIENYLPVGKKVRFILISTVGPYLGDPHPIHFHGHKMKVLAQGHHGFNETTGIANKLESELDRISIQQPQFDYPVEISGQFSDTGKIEIEKRINHNGPLKDVVVLQGGGWAYVEVELSNPGIWAMDNPDKKFKIMTCLN